MWKIYCYGDLIVMVTLDITVHQLSIEQSICIMVRCISILSIAYYGEVYYKRSVVSLVGFAYYSETSLISTPL